MVAFVYFMTKVNLWLSRSPGKNLDEKKVWKLLAVYSKSSRYVGKQLINKKTSVVSERKEHFYSLNWYYCMQSDVGNWTRSVFRHWANISLSKAFKKLKIALKYNRCLITLPPHCELSWWSFIRKCHHFSRIRVYARSSTSYIEQSGIQVFAWCASYVVSRWWMWACSVNNLMEHNHCVAFDVIRWLKIR